MVRYYRPGSNSEHRVDRTTVIITVIAVLALIGVALYWLIQETLEDIVDPRTRDVAEFTEAFNQHVAESGIYLAEPVSYEDIEPCDLILMLPDGRVGRVVVTERISSSKIEEVYIEYNGSSSEGYMDVIVDGLIGVFTPELYTADPEELFSYSFEQGAYESYSYESIMQDCRDCDGQVEYSRSLNHTCGSTEYTVYFTIKSERDGNSVTKSILFELQHFKSYAF